MKSFTKLPVFLIALATIAGLEGRADACSPPLPGLAGSIPSTGETYPGNAAVFFLGYDISLTSVSVKVDGQPASFMAAPDIDALGLGSLAARIVPTPAKGQMVTIEGDFCPAASPCGNSVITFTAGDADNTPPAAPTTISFDLHDYPDFKSSGGDCQSDSDLGWWIDVEATPPAASESLVALRVEAFRDETFQEVVFAESTFLSSTKQSLSSHHTINVLNGADAPEAFCFRASLRDVAGNPASETVHACAPCNYREDAAGMPGFSPPSEPTWTPADIYAGGPCGDGAGGSGGSSGSGGAGGSGGSGDDSGGGDEGCGCRLAGGESSREGYAALALLALAAITRRRR